MSSPLRLSLSHAVALCSILLTLVIADAIWESYYPRTAARLLRERRAYYEKVLLEADLSWKEALYYKQLGNATEKR